MIERIPAANRSTWLALRERDVTASVAGALLGVHPFMTPWALHCLKTGKLRDDIEESPPMLRGRLLEPVAVQLLREMQPDWKVVHNTGKAQVYLRDPAIRLGATPDVFVRCKKRGNGIIQTKSVEQSIFRHNWMTDEGEADAPLWICAQAMVEAHLAGADFAMVGALVVSHGVDLHLIDIPLHAGLLDRIKAETSEFWRRIAAGEEPEPDYGADGALLASLYGGPDNGREIDLSGDNRIQQLLAERAALLLAAGETKTAIDTVNAEIVAKMGDFERAYVPGWKLSRPLVHRRAHWIDTSSGRQLKITAVGR